MSLLLVLSLLRKVFLWVIRFSPLLKTNISKFQFEPEWYTKNHFVDVLPLNSYLFIISFFLSFFLYLLNKTLKQNAKSYLCSDKMYIL